MLLSRSARRQRQDWGRENELKTRGRGWIRGREAKEFFGWLEEDRPAAKHFYFVWFYLCVCVCWLMTYALLWDGVRNPDCLQHWGGGIPILTRGPHAVTSVRRGFSLFSVCECVHASLCVFVFSSFPSPALLLLLLLQQTLCFFFIFYLLLHTATFFSICLLFFLSSNGDISGDEFEHRLRTPFCLTCSMDCLCILTTKVRGTTRMNDSLERGWEGDMDWGGERMRIVGEWGMQ